MMERVVEQLLSEWEREGSAPDFDDQFLRSIDILRPPIMPESDFDLTSDLDLTDDLNLLPADLGSLPREYFLSQSSDSPATPWGLKQSGLVFAFPQPMSCSPSDSGSSDSVCSNPTAPPRSACHFIFPPQCGRTEHFVFPDVESAPTTPSRPTASQNVYQGEYMNYILSKHQQVSMMLYVSCSRGHSPMQAGGGRGGGSLENIVGMGNR